MRLTLRQKQALAFAAIFTACTLSEQHADPVAVKARDRAVAGLRLTELTPDELRDLGLQLLDTHEAFDG